MPTVHLVAGPVGAGKTTLARRLGGIVFSTDDWMAKLFLPEAPDPPVFEWMIERVKRCEAMMWTMAQQVLANGQDVVLDWGLMRREHRDRVRALANAWPTRLHVADAPADERRRRVRERNGGTETFAFAISDATFDWSERYFEPIAEDER